jgi:protein-S-isoprenylcysteine O-methyltransferase Ste14
MSVNVPRRSPLLFVPPPPVFVAMFFAGRALQRAIPVVLPDWLRFVGALPLAFAAWMLLTPPLLFLLRKTTIIPHGDARTLITTGPYRVTRNPMYLGLACAFVGVALITGTPWALVGLPIPIALLAGATIPFEEQNLLRIFGAEYREYQRRVPRWL